MKKSLLAVVLLAGGCMAGPGPWHHAVDDHWNKKYQEDPIVTTVFSSILPLYPIVMMVAWIPDALVFNLVQFWGTDVSEGTGAAFIHDNPSETKTAWYLK